MSRISKADWKQALKARYKDLREGLQGLRLAGVHIEHDNKEAAELKAIAAIAKLHGVDIKGD